MKSFIVDYFGPEWNFKVFTYLLSSEWFSMQHLCSRGNLSHRLFLTLRRPLGKNCGCGGFSTFPRWMRRVSLNRTSLTPLRFSMRIFWKFRFKPFQISFFSEFFFQHHVLGQMFIQTNQFLITSFYIKRYLFYLISDESALIRNFLRNGHVRE